MSVRKNTLDGLFSGIEDITDARGKVVNTVLYSKAGNYSSIFEIENPVQQYCTDADQYYAFMNVLDHILQTLGEGYALQKQDVFCRQAFHHDITPGMEFLTESYFRYYEGRPYTEIRTFIIITQETRKSTFVAYDPKKWAEFNNKVQKVKDIFEEKGLRHHLLDRHEIDEYLHRFMAFDFKKGPFGMTNLKCSDESLRMGERTVKSFSLVDIDVIDLPTLIKPVQTVPVNGYSMSTDLLSFLATVPLADCVVYNQVIQIPAQRKERQRLIGKSKRHASMPDPSNKLAKADIDEVLEVIATEQKTMVWTNFNILVSCKPEHLTKVTSYLETRLFEVGIAPSKSAYNQLELFCCSFPGNAYSFNKDYDLFLTLQDSALCLFYKERMKHDEVTPLKVYYTDRQGVPIAIDFTGKEGELKLTNNSNFFCLGPSGSGKSFSTNTVVRQLIEQCTDVVMVDTGDSYEGICGYFHGTYISYSKEHPISMNPFKVSDVEYQQNFGEKKNFLKSLIFQIFKGNKAPEKLEDTIIDTVLNEYYDAYFHPFTGYTNEEKEELRKQLLLADKRNGKYGESIEEIEKDADVVSEDGDIANTNVTTDKQTYTEDEKAHHAKVQRIVEKLHNLANDEGASAGERAHANNQLMRLMPELIEGHYLMKIDQRIARMERQKRDLKVTHLSFDTFYEFACERIPQMMEEKSIAFPINEFAAILEPFHKGGKMDTILNNDMDLNLFDEKFIVFEIDKIKDDPVLFPIVVLIIMDVFLQKMRIKKGRKALIIEEAWKAISSPTMAEYIKYLYKTVRKFHGIAGVVTQELGDVIDSPIVKEAIINNSDIKILLDQSKFKDRYDEIAAILGITDVQRQQIFTINSLDNHEGRNYFKEVWICRGQSSDVYGVEEPPECYMAYTTERAEKEALKIYIKHYGGDTIEGIRHFCKDMEKAGLTGKYLKFANEVNKQQKIMELWERTA